MLLKNKSVELNLSKQRYRQTPTSINKFAHATRRARNFIILIDVALNLGNFTVYE